MRDRAFLWENSEWRRKTTSDQISTELLSHVIMSYYYDYDEDMCPLVIDIGSGSLRIGYPGQDDKSLSIRNALGVSKYKRVVDTTEYADDVYINQEDIFKSGLVDIKWPVKHGVIKNIDDFEKIWTYATKKIKADVENHPCLICDSPNAPVSQRVEIAEKLFQSYNVPSIGFQRSDALALLSTRRKTGLVVESGEGVTSVSVFVDGYKWIPASKVLHVAGNSITSYLRHKLIAEHPEHARSLDILTVEDIKKRLCYVPKDGHLTGKEAYILPGDQLISIESLRGKAGAFMFGPKLMGLEMPGIHQVAYEAILKSKPSDREKLWENIVLAGGNTTMKGFVDRFKAELTARAPKGVKVNVIAPDNRQDAAFQGGLAVGGMQVSRRINVTKDDYLEDNGIIERRFS